jgi:hypothetical protein
MLEILDLETGFAQPPLDVGYQGAKWSAPGTRVPTAIIRRIGLIDIFDPKPVRPGR